VPPLLVTDITRVTLLLILLSIVEFPLPVNVPLLLLTSIFAVILYVPSRITTSQPVLGRACIAAFISTLSAVPSHK